MPVKHGPPLADSETRIQAFESKCLRKLLRISYLEHKTNGLVRSKISFLLGSQEPLLATVERLKLAWSGHVTLHDSFCKTILGGWATPGSAEEMLAGQRQRVDIPAHARSAELSGTSVGFCCSPVCFSVMPCPVCKTTTTENKQ